MTWCEHRDDVEDWALGLVDGTFAELHLASCGACRDAHRRMVAEVALFERRATAVPLPPALPLLEPVPNRARPAFDAIRILVGVAACAAATCGVGVFRSSVSAIDCAGAVPASAVAPFSADEPLACAFPGSGFVRAPVLASRDEELACIVRADRSTCEEDATFSRSTP